MTNRKNEKTNSDNNEEYKRNIGNAWKHCTPRKQNKNKELQITKPETILGNIRKTKHATNITNNNAEKAKHTKRTGETLKN